jgi:hypothetical protein
VNRERAESQLRRLAEAERRRMMALPADRFNDQWFSRKLELVAQALAALGAVDEGTARQIQADFGRASTMRLLSLLNAAGPGPGGLSPDVRGRLERLRQVKLVQLAQADDPVVPVSGHGAGQVGSQQATRVVPVGQVISAPMLHGAVTLLAYLQAPGGARFAATFGATFGMARPPGSRGSGPGPATEPQQHQLTVADDQGASYQPVFMRGPGGGVLTLHPAPPHQIRWLDFTTAPGEPAIRVDLGPQDWQLRAPDVTVTHKAHSPGELLLDVIATKILTLAADLPQDNPEQLAAATRELRAFAAEGLGELVAALQAAAVLSAASPVPGQLAGLCTRLGLSGHGITAPPAGLPEPWESMLTRYHRRQPYQPPAPGSWAAPVAELPELDGTRITIFGLEHGAFGHTMILHALVSGVTMEDDWKYARVVRPLPVFWIQDDSGRWHTTETHGIAHPVVNGEVVLWLRIWPPLDRSTTWIDVVATGQSAEARATLPLRWKLSPPVPVVSALPHRR